jgi:hypothetical protein
VIVMMVNLAYLLTDSGLIRFLLVVPGTFAVNFLVWVIRAAVRPPQR